MRDNAFQLRAQTRHKYHSRVTVFTVLVARFICRAIFPEVSLVDAICSLHTYNALSDTFVYVRNSYDN